MFIGIGLRLGMLGSVFSPANLFSSNEQGAWFDPSPTTCFTDTARSTAASVGDAVAGLTDLSGNGNHATQSTTSARPILRQTGGGFYYLEFDGVDDNFDELAGVVTPGNGSIIVAGVDGQAATGDRNGMFAFVGVQSASSDHFGGDGAQADLFVTAFGTARANPVNNDNLLNALQVVTFHHNSGTLRYRRNGAEIGTASSTLEGSACSIWLGRSKTISSVYFKGNLYGLVVRGASSDATEIDSTEAYFAAKTGVTL